MTLALALVGGACQTSIPETPDTALDTSVDTQNTFRVELASAIVPPGTEGCDVPAGRIIVASWGEISWRDFDSTTTTNLVPGSAELPLPNGVAPDGLRGDPSIVRMKNGEFLYLRWTQFTAPIIPAPAWHSFTGESRAGLLIWRSKCGDSWSVASVLDSHAVVDGKCAWPQEIKHSSPPIIGAAGTWYEPWPGGWDRSEMYADPFDGTVYLTTLCRGGTARAFRPPSAGGIATDGVDHLFAEAMIFRSTDWGTTWGEPIHRTTNYAAPMALTSTSSGRLVALYCNNATGIMEILVTQRNKGAWLRTYPVPLDSSQIETNCGAVDWPVAEEVGQQVLTADYQLSRSGPDSVRAAIQQGSRVDVYDLRFKSTSGEFQDPLDTWQLLLYQYPEDYDSSSNGSIVHADFIEADHTGATIQGSRDAAVLYWTEHDADANETQARYRIFYDETTYTDEVTISAAPWSPKVGGPTGDGGDYHYGAYYYAGRVCNYLLVWPTSGAADPSSVIHYAVVADDQCIESGVAPPPPPPPAASPTPAVVPTVAPPLVTASPAPSATPLATPRRTKRPRRSPTPQPTVATPAPPVDTPPPSSSPSPAASPVDAGTMIGEPLVSTPLFYVNAGCIPRDVAVTVAISDDDEVVAAELYYRLADKASDATTEFVFLPMAETRGGLWTVAVDALNVPAAAFDPAWFQFQVLATDGVGAQTLSTLYEDMVTATVCKP